MTYKYKKVAVGGTFDRLHEGHKRLLDKAFEVGERVAVGVTSDEFVDGKSFSGLILPYQERVTTLEVFLKQLGAGGRYELVKLDDVYGTTLADEQIEALVVSEQTVEGAEKVNHKRLEIGKSEFPVVVVGMVVDTTGEHLSSTRIRGGKVGRNGTVYKQVFEKGLVITEEQKQILRVPMGKLVRMEEIISGEKQVAVVGDVSLGSFIEIGKRFNYGVFDGTSGRETKTSDELVSDVVVKNPAGQITKEAVDGIDELLTMENGLLRVEGEEDLMVLPMLLLLPLSSEIYYGQPGEGLVRVEVTEIAKNRWYEFLRA